jgi:hypothetical protein
MRLTLAPRLLLVLTVIYLTVEVAFTSYLIEVLGSAPSSDEVHWVESVGRTLTGVALALVLVPLALPRLARFVPEGRWWAVALIGAGLGAACIVVARQGIERLVTVLTDRTSAEARRNALVVNAGVARIHALEDGKPTLLVNDVFLPDSLRESIEGRVVLAALPFLLANTGEIEERLTPALEQAARERIAAEYGNPARLFNQSYVPLMRDYARALYDGYAEAANQARKAKRDQLRQADEAWDSYVRSVSRYRLTPAEVADTPRYRERASKDLRKQIPSAPVGWVPRQREDFDALFGEEIGKAYRQAIQQLGFTPGRFRAIEDYAQSVMPAAFFAHPHTRELWGVKVSEKVSDAPLADRLGTFGPRLGGTAVFAAFERELYGPLIGERIEEEVGRLKAEIAAYAGGGRLGEDAYAAMKVIVVVPIAILFSMLGAAGHTLKGLYLAGRSLGLPARAMGMTVLVTAAGAIVAASAATPGLTEARPEVKRMMGDLERRVSPALIRFVVVGQTAIYPMGRTVRQMFSKAG